MKTARIMYKGAPRYALADGDKLRILSEAPYDGIELTGEVCSVSEAEFSAPCEPTKIVAIGKNYHAHAMEMKEGEPTEPLLFLKPSTCVIADGEDIVYPSISHRLDYEGELGVVIGKKCRNASRDDALSYVFGYVCLNDVTARDIQKSDPQWTRGKGFDTFCPLGKYIVTDIDAGDLMIQTRLNGEVKQSSRTGCMTHDIPKLIEYISRVMTLLPGDIIATGTPEGIGPMQAGDIVEVEIENIGVLRNRVISE